MDIVIVGFGNVGRKVYSLARAGQEFRVVGVLTRDPNRVKHVVGSDIPVLGFSLRDWPFEYGAVAINCGGSAQDLPCSGPWLAQRVSCVDSFDTHGHVAGYVDKKTGLPCLGYFEVMDHVAKATGHTALVCQGWDPGLFSVARAIFQSCLETPVKAYAFYGLTPGGGLSMGHSDALRRVSGVLDARQFTHACPEAIKLVEEGGDPSIGEMHWRECFVAIEPGADEERIRSEIVTMEGYFAPYRTTVEFLPLEVLRERFKTMPHDGMVIARSPNGLLKLEVQWESNPLATASILLAYARATRRTFIMGSTGAYTPLSVSPDLLLPDGMGHLPLI